MFVFLEESPIRNSHQTSWEWILKKQPLARFYPNFIKDTGNKLKCTETDEAIILIGGCTPEGQNLVDSIVCFLS
jgi:hypothetical protein